MDAMNPLISFTPSTPVLLNHSFITTLTSTNTTRRLRCPHRHHHHHHHHHHPRKLPPIIVCQANAQPPAEPPPLEDDTFFLPANLRPEDPHRPLQPHSPTANASLQAQRQKQHILNVKGSPAAAATSATASSERRSDNDDELRQSQIAAEKLSASDLLGGYTSEALTSSSLERNDGNIGDSIIGAVDDDSVVSQGPTDSSAVPTRIGVDGSSPPASPLSPIRIHRRTHRIPNLAPQPNVNSSRRRSRKGSPTSPPSTSSTSHASSSESSSETSPTSTSPSTESAGDENTDNNNRTRSSSSRSIQIGDLVNHRRHGIGRFLGLQLTRGDVNDSVTQQEFVVIEYRDGDVFVPLSQFDLIRRLPDAQANSVEKLDVISGSATYKGYGVSSRSRRASFMARQRTRQKIRRQLVNLHGMYAQRTTIDREPFPVDVESERDFNALCPFGLTRDQQTAVDQIMKDMSERRRPMDRLLCGDVGFGKTEVAIRAVIRALLAGRQVAVLAPTTILAQQHFETFSGRLGAYDPSITVACFNRFVPRKEVLQRRDQIASGELSVAIGTHMLLSDHVIFKNLGLLVVDEEHRFGVNQKEKMRERYQDVDALFMSATPIPRTLNLALSGLRDASVLRTPPYGRKPIVTRVIQKGAGVVRDAIEREIDRGGQVFFVVPRVEGIEATKDWVQDLFTHRKVRVLYAHASLKDLEKRIWSFAQREYDVLVSTTIIENGIHMPDVNTIIIQDASRFGLAQLHQLRGRVGRSELQAYALLLFDSGDISRVTTFERLKTLETNASLGAGFKIAQRDMEMRGIGTILGVEQHGNNAVGSVEYARMLAQELEHARTGEPIPISLPVTDSVEIFLPVASLIPDDYVQDFEMKMMLYKLMSDSKTVQDLAKIARRLGERYGPLPTETKRHLALLEVKILGKDLGIRRVISERQHVILDWAVEAAAVKRLVAFLPDKLSRDRCEHVEAEERVVLRGLGMCPGDVQLAKVLMFLKCFSKSAVGLRREEKNVATTGLTTALMTTGEGSM